MTPEEARQILLQENFHATFAQGSGDSCWDSRPGKCQGNLRPFQLVITDYERHYSFCELHWHDYLKDVSRIHHGGKVAEALTVLSSSTRIF